ncbi:MAG: caspase family protein [Chitinophagaceae bacterium]|nr:caspase family protein [Chitinophagaceae bacterium]
MRKLLCLLLGLYCLGLHAQTPDLGRDPSGGSNQTFAMVIGISKYKYIRPLSYADKDADLFADYLRSPSGGSLKESNIFKLTNEMATSANFWSKGFQWLKGKDLKKGDRLYIYLAGHGDAIDEDQFFFLGYDVNPGSDKDNYLISGAVQLYNLKKKIANETSKGVEVYFIMDACRTNELPGGSAGQNFLNIAVSQKKAGEVMMLAAAAGQESLEDVSIGNGHGLFTWYLVDGLTGMADDDNNSKVNFNEIRNYVDKNVPLLAQSRFKRKQVPYFCCDEYGNKIISNVDAEWLRNWNKKKGPGNSFTGDPVKRIAVSAVDTTLIETYNNFNKAIKGRSLEGANSAENYYSQLMQKYPNNPYTLDAQSTLAAEFINDAQQRLNDYIGCVSLESRDKKEWLAAGRRLERAMPLIEDYEPDYARSLKNRAYLLEALGTEDLPAAFAYAHAAMAIEPRAAYINNCLAMLHMKAGHRDSALYYAENAVKRAPNWPCALSTIALVRQMKNNEPSKPKDPTKKARPFKPALGFNLGAGVNNSNPTYEARGSTQILAASSASAAVMDLGINYFLPVGSSISIRPGLSYVYGNMNIYFTERGNTGTSVRSRVDIKNSALDISLPVIFHFKGKKQIPYLSLGPSLKYTLSASNELLPLKKSLVMAHAGFGVDFPVSKSGMVITPELKFAAGLTDMRDPNANTNYSNALGSLKRQEFLFNVYLRKK